MKSFKCLLALVMLAGSLSACDWIGEDDEEDHVRIAGVVLYENGAEIARYQNGTSSGAVTVAEGQETDHIVVRLLDFDGAFISEDAVADENSLEVTSGDTRVASVEREDGEEWAFHVGGVQAGATTLTLTVLHGDHDDFRTVDPIDVVVTEAPAQ